MMTKMYLLKLEVEQVEMKQHCLQQIYSECIQDMLNVIDWKIETNEC